MIGVLVVDDDFRVARIHAAFVERTDGFAVVGTAHTGEAALALAEDLRPGLVLLDVHLPDMTGLEVLDRLRGSGSRAAVVMVTAERGADAVRAALHGGAMQYLVKPFEYADLADRLHRVAEALGTLGTGEADQQSIDHAFGTARPSRRPAPVLPKGLSPESADLVLGAVRDAGELSAAEAGERVGLSRVSARRYLEYFVDTGRAEVRLQYGSAGRPERRYRAR